MFKAPETTDAGHTGSHVVTKRDQKSRNVTLPLLPLPPVTLPPVTSPFFKSPPAVVTSRVRPPVPPEAEAAARRLLDQISANTPTSTLAKLPESAKRDRAQKWADAFRLLHERDGHSWEEINAMVDWCQADSFWKSNILSGDKLREKWDQLAAKKANGSVDGYDVRYGRARLPSPEEYEQEDDPFGERTPKPGAVTS